MKGPYLTKREEALFECVAAAEGIPVSHREIVDSVWDGIGDRSLVAANVANIRRKFGYFVIRTRHGAGYYIFPIDAKRVRQMHQQNRPAHAETWRTCERCGQSFYGRYRKFCGDACRAEARSAAWWDIHGATHVAWSDRKEAMA